ncbi:tetratricopeptide repeat protein [Trichlorobacter ammonificans]|uniref:Tetratricopeptide domain protein n=1 Tax=Trichlorobacter ammonificans TaxID=2916410 RepID=A0ABM9D408_9BACT|nr:tetratricopeptide repeat protein [Trichlorobacter ammonificans]CAH2029982.1 Tetratricopeptide domain protein [Trichlorobacter ammonificans]
MNATWSRAMLKTMVPIGCLALVVALLFPGIVSAAPDVSANRILRVEIKNIKQLTRITLSCEAEPRYTVTALPGDRVRIRFSNTDGPLFKAKRRYSDSNIGGLVFRRSAGDMLLTFAVAPQRVGWRVVHASGVAALSIDIGPKLGEQNLPPVLPGRERIRSGAEKLLKDFDPPLKPEIPFVPTDRQVLSTLLGAEDQNVFLTAESALYKGQLTAAEEVFQQFAARQGPVRPLALYRLAEAQYRLQKYAQSLATFREAVQLWDAFFSLNPAAMFYYGDSIARNGDLPGGRQLLARLIATHADKKYAPVLLVRMADVLARQGHDAEAWAIYRTVATEFREGKAPQIARIKLADRELLHSTPDNYRTLAAVYRTLAETAADYDLREEAAFKHALLEAVNGPPDSALELVKRYQKRFPKGVFLPITKDMREDLVLLSYRAKKWDNDPPGLISLASDNQEFLALASGYPGFFPAVTEAFAKIGRPLDLIALYVNILQRPWVGRDSQAYLTLEIADQAELLGDDRMARKTLESFLRRNPDHPKVQEAREKLGALLYRAKDLTGVRAQLAWLLAKDTKAARPISYYYLGRALWESKQYAQAALAMETYAAAVRAEKEQPPLVGDAYYIAALSEQAQGRLSKAASLLQEGMNKVAPERRDQFLYKLGEVALQDNRVQQAREFFEQIVRSGTDSDWRRLARQALLDRRFPSEPQSKKP